MQIHHLNGFLLYRESRVQDGFSDQPISSLVAIQMGQKLVDIKAWSITMETN
jgi:hypothetical protein